MFERGWKKFNNMTEVNKYFNKIANSNVDIEEKMVNFDKKPKKLKFMCFGKSTVKKEKQC